MSGFIASEASRQTHRFILATQRSKLPPLAGEDKKSERYLSSFPKHREVWMKLIARRPGPPGGRL
jgi:hypothetical protein